VQAKRPLRRFTVRTCANACRRRSTHFAVQCGGFCSGNGHRLARCFCAKVPYRGSSERKRARAECATTCSLHDSRPCGGSDAAAVYLLRPLPKKVLSHMAGGLETPLGTQVEAFANATISTPYDAAGDLEGSAKTTGRKTRGKQIGRKPLGRFFSRLGLGKRRGAAEPAASNAEPASANVSALG